MQLLETGDSREVPGAVGQAVYRIVQEALTNIIRHANAHKGGLNVRPRILALPSPFVIKGVGQGAIVAGNGIRGMTERAAESGGRLTVISPRPDAGTVVTAVLPRPQSEQVLSAEGRDRKRDSGGG